MTTYALADMYVVLHDIDRYPLRGLHPTLSGLHPALSLIDQALSLIGLKSKNLPLIPTCQEMAGAVHNLAPVQHLIQCTFPLASRGAFKSET